MKLSLEMKTLGKGQNPPSLKDENSPIITHNRLQSHIITFGRKQEIRTRSFVAAYATRMLSELVEQESWRFLFVSNVLVHFCVFFFLLQKSGDSIILFLFHRKIFLKYSVVMHQQVWLFVANVEIIQNLVFYLDGFEFNVFRARRRKVERFFGRGLGESVSQDWLSFDWWICFLKSNVI